MLHYQEVLSATEAAITQQSIPERLLALPSEVLYKERNALLKDGVRLQHMVQKEIIARAQGSCYAIDHGFSYEMDIDTWQNDVPITLYQDYAPYIDAELEGAFYQLYRAETALFIATTGSTGRTKLFMESAAGNAAKLLVMAIRGMYMGDLLPVTRDMEAKNLTISNYAQLGSSRKGQPILRASGQTARNLRRKTGTMNILSTQFWTIPDLLPTERDYMMGVFALAERRLSKVFCNNLYALGRVLDQVQAHAEAMIEDVRTGHFSIAVQSETAHHKADKLLQACPKRAEELRQLFEAKGALIRTPDDILDIWPNCQMVSCWLSGSVGRDAREVLRRLPSNVKCFDMGYGASEGKFNIPTKLACAAGVLAPFAAFYEFRPLGQDIKPLCMWEVEDGAYYELLMTNYSGLYRYNMLDIVRIDGFFGETPNVVFCGKSTEYVEINSTKLYGFQLSDVVYEVEQEHDICFDVVQFFAQDNALYYVLESERELDYAALKQTLDQRTFLAWGIKSEGICVMKSSYKKHAFDQRVRVDRGACGIKLPVVLKTMPHPEEIRNIVTAV